MIRKRLLALALVLTMAASALAGCGGGGQSASSSGEGTGTQESGEAQASGAELTVVTSYGGDDGNRTNYENAIAAFQAETGNTILDASSTSNEEWKAKVLTDFETGTEPDVLFFFTNADAEPFIEAGKVVDIATIRGTYPEYASNMKDSMLAVASDGSLNMDAAAQKWVDGLNDIKELYEKGFFPDNTLTATDAETVQLFAEGEAAFLIDGSWKVGHFVENYPDQLEDYALAYVPAKGERKATEAIGGISMGYFITTKAWEDPAKQAAAVAFVEYMTSDEVLSTFVTTEVTALTNGASPEGLNSLQQSAADANSAITGVIGAVQDTLTSECKTDLFANIQHVVTGDMTAEDAVASAIALN